MYRIETSDNKVLLAHGEEQFAEEVAAAITTYLKVNTTVYSRHGVKLHEFFA